MQADQAGSSGDSQPETTEIRDPPQADLVEVSGAVSQDPARTLSSTYTMGDQREIMKALETVERDSVAIAESFTSLFSSLQLSLSDATSTSIENMECFNEVIGRLQESALDAASKGNKYINSCLRLNEEMRGLETLAMQFHFGITHLYQWSYTRKRKSLEEFISLNTGLVVRKNVDTLDLAVTRLLRLP